MTSSYTVVDGKGAERIVFAGADSGGASNFVQIPEGGATRVVVAGGGVPRSALAADVAAETLDLAGKLLDRGLDVWDEFDANGSGSVSWSALTYATYLSGLDALFAPLVTAGTVVRTDLGASSDAAKHVVSYRAGSGPVQVLLVGGTHGAETLGIYAAMRWFEQFVKSDDITYRSLRKQLTVTWIPVLSPTAYRAGRKNANSVDLNRNYDLLWSRYSPSGTIADVDYKGAAPFDQPETAIIRDLMTANDFRVAIDCHNYGSQGDSINYQLPGAWLLGARGLGLETVSAWQALYGTGIVADQLSKNNTQPNFDNYANYVMRHVKGHANSASITLEGSQDLKGSTTTFVTRGAIRIYAGLIHTYLLKFLEKAVAPVGVPYAYSYYGRIPSETTLSSTTYAPVTFNQYLASGAVLPKTVMDVPIAYAGAALFVEVSGFLAPSTAAAGRFQVGIQIDGTIDGAMSVTTGANIGDAIPFSALGYKRYDTVSNVSVPTVSLMVRKVTGGDALVKMVMIRVTVMPDTNDVMIPPLNGA